MLTLMKIQGDSMLPELADGDFVLISQLFFRLKQSDLVVVNHPKYKRIIKAIKQVSKTQGYLLEGRHPSSVSSDEMGWVQTEDILGKVIFTVTG